MRTVGTAALVLGFTLLSAGARAEVVTSTPPGTYKVVPSSSSQGGPHTLRVDLPPRHRILFMNRNGGTYTPSFVTNDSVHNISSVPTETSTVPPFARSDADWQTIMTCVTRMYEPFDIEVTDVEPGDVDYIESVVGGRPGDVGMPNGVGGVSPFDDQCAIIERAIVFTFAAVYGSNLQAICETVAQESAHAFGLDHELLCQDPMTYLSGCGKKTFQDTDARCGEFNERDCACGNPTQNSVQSFLRFLGTSDSVPATISIVEPVEGGTVYRGFNIVADVQDDQRVAWVELWMDGEKVTSRDEPPWTFSTNLHLPFGVHSFELRAVDKGRNVTTQQLNVSVESQCTTDAECGEGLACGDNRCAQALATPCSTHSDCASSECGRDLDGQLSCTQACGDGCPSGFACEDSTQLCWPSQGGTGCSLGGRPRGAVWIGIVLGFVVLAAFVRRRR